MKIKVYTLNAFAKTISGGNPAGVVFDADTLSDIQMRNIAKVIGFSETAFIQHSDKADLKIRFFTPTDEVDLCGHATIAAFYLMAEMRILTPGKYTQETKAGILQVEIGQDHVIYMNQNKPCFCEEISKSELSDSLNIPAEYLMNDFPAQIVSTGLRDILIPFNSLEQLLGMKPDFKKVAEISKKYHVTGYHLFSMETLNSSTAHCRNLAPLFDIPEEAATGTSSGALACYLNKYGLIPQNRSDHLIFEQGYSMDRPSEIYSNLMIQNNEIAEVKVGGIARNINSVEIEI